MLKEKVCVRESSSPMVMIRGLGAIYDGWQGDKGMDLYISGDMNGVGKGQR